MDEQEYFEIDPSVIKNNSALINSDTIRHYCTFEKTMNLRWEEREISWEEKEISDGVMFYRLEKTLQQMNECIYCGKTKWINIETINEINDLKTKGEIQ
jgi:hypothetical protein